MRNDGKEYEAMVHSVYTSLCKDERFSKVEKDVKMAGPDGLRQIDVLVTHVHANIEYKTIIECRDFAGKLNVTHIDAFGSKIADIKANKGIIVSRKGFSKTAIRKAGRLGIGLCIVDTTETVLKEMALELPMIAVTIELSLHVSITVKPTRETILRKSEWTSINDIPLSNLVIDELENGDIAVPDETKTISWKPNGLNPPFYIRDVDGDPINIESFDVQLTLVISYMFGTSNDIPDSISHVQLDSGEVHVVIPDTFRMKLNKTFVKYRARSEIPIPVHGAILAIMWPQRDVEWEKGAGFVRDMGLSEA